MITLEQRKKQTEVLRKLNRHFAKSMIMFEKSIQDNPLPTVCIKLKPDKYLLDDQFCLSEHFKSELLEILNKCNVDACFNNTGHSFWW